METNRNALLCQRDLHFACHRTNLPLQMVVMSSLAAAVQGMDEAVINGAQIIYPTQFGIGDSTSSEYLSSNIQVA